MPKLPMSETYSKSSHEPVDHPDKLVSWWGRPLPTEYDPKEIFDLYKVKVLGNEKLADDRKLTFILARQEGPSAPVFDLDLMREASYVWPDAPSTAQHATPGQYGFLVLSQSWAEGMKVDANKLAEGGVKWPLSLYFDERVNKVLKLLAHPTHGAKLLQTVDTLSAMIGK